jgi:hypothetical protein
VANTSKVITCNREFANGDICNRPVVPVFGAWPEECTSCASRILATKKGFEAAERLIEEHFGRLRALVIAASVQDNPWAVKDTHSRFTLLDKLAADIGSRRLMMRMSIARRLDAAKKETSGKLVNEPRRTALGSMWRSVTPERAIELKQGGFETRFIGVAWQVKVS